MEKLLILGLSTRALVNSALQLDYQTYCSSYYHTTDSKVPYKEKHILQQKPHESCGFFREKFNPIEILLNSLDWIESADYIILNTGISPGYFNGNIKKNDLTPFRLENVKNNLNLNELNNILKKNKNKIIGNKNTESIENKYKFYKKTKNKYSLPLTFKLKNPPEEIEEKNNKVIIEAIEIAKQYEDKEFILKELNGSGGYGINLLNNKFKNYGSNTKRKTNPLILQEYIHGDDISCSLLSNPYEVKAIVASKNLNNAHYQKNQDIKDFKYSGNITPFEKDKYNKLIVKEIHETSEDLISKLNLIGSNGVDLIVKNNGEINIIEVNPRFQGTYECVEEVLGINLLKAHIDACFGERINIQEPKNHTIKKIIYAKKRLKFNGLKNLRNNLNKNISLHDLPYKDAIIEANQPLLTIFGKNNKLSNLKIDIEKVNNQIDNALYD